MKDADGYLNEIRENLKKIQSQGKVTPTENALFGMIDGLAGLQMAPKKIRLGGNNHIGRLLAHVFLDHGNGHARQPAAERFEAAKQSAVQRAEEPGHTLRV